jgi:UDP-N-acetylmuramoyl-L-alanyl-D-glutamate--2,6-diaminopimelate ligase
MICNDSDPRISLAGLLSALPDAVFQLDTEVLVTGIALDSRSVQPGNLFVALQGGMLDGHRFIPDAIQRGAVAVVGTQPLSELAVPYIRVEDGRRALAYLSAAFYGFPARRMLMIGVTGTDGKTTTSNLIYQILRAANVPVGMISTVNAVIGDEVLDTGFHVTTPEAPDVQRFLAQMVAAGLSHAVIEATSHGLAQQRVAACDFDIGVVTNITHEHLDFHGTYEAYRAAKSLLFSGLGKTADKTFSPPRGAVLNRDDLSYDHLASLSKVKQVSYGLHPAALLRAEDITPGTDGLHFSAVWQDESGRNMRIPIYSQLPGMFNLSNCLAAIAVTANLLGLDREAIQKGIAAVRGIPGRMEKIDLGQDFTAMVDFAHTPNALRRALEAGRQMTSGRVIAIFGSAGLRDRAKRRLMAETSIRLADLTILTAEDPRTESLEMILAEMAAGAATAGGEEGKNFWRIPDRGEAIRSAVNLAQPGDLVIACGKGHEQSMCFDTIEYTWDDRIAMRAALADRLGEPGPEMPYLPTQNR